MISKKIVIWLLFYFFIFNQVFANICISEVLPNTIDDKNLEYIELHNSWTKDLSLSWYSLEDKSSKTYSFWTWEILTSNQKKKYFRTQTKIILNNVDEEIYLKANLDIIDSFIYDTSIKWEVLKKEWAISNIWNGGVVSNTWIIDTWSWEIESNSWSIKTWTWDVEISTWATNTWVLDIETNPWITDTWSWNVEINTWITDTATWKTNIWNILEIPEVEIEVQSWLEYSWTWNTWKCKKEDCKINLTLEKSFTWIYDQKNYECLWDFWTWAFFSTWTELKCNPWYIDYSTWIYEITAKIYEEWNETNFQTWGLIVDDLFWYTQNESNSWTIDTWSWYTKTSFWTTNTWVKLKAPEVTWSFQIPSYLIWKEDKSAIYNCDRTKTECKINLDLRNSFSEDLKESAFLCINDFWLWYINWEEDKCNPNTVVVPVWSYNFNFKIQSKTDSWVFFTWTFLVINEWYKEPITTTKASLSSWWNQVSSINIKKPEISIQSWLELIWDKYLCKKEDCKVNLIYEPKDTQERCLWKFTGWDYIDSTFKKCNPWYINYPLWNYKIELKVYQKNKQSNYKESYLYFKNLDKSDSILETTKENIILIDEITEDKKVNIILQWKLAKYKNLNWNILICNWVSRCSVNLNSEVSGYKVKKNLTYSWDFWDGTYSNLENPKWVWYNSWEYLVSLRVYEENKLFWESDFQIFVKQKEEKIEDVLEEKIIENKIAVWEISINKVLPNPKWTDEKERIELKNNTDKALNLKWCSLDDDIDKWSKQYNFSEDYYILANKTKKIYKVFSKINLNNNKDSVNLFCNDKLIDSLNWNFNVKEWYYLNHIRLSSWEFKAQVLRVIDWDTIIVQLENWEKMTIRFIWVDTPENNNYKKIFEAYWKKASEFTKKYLEGREVIIERDSDNLVDKYWRILWYVILDWENFNKLLLEKWIARPYFKYPFKYIEDFNKAYKKAQKEKIWIWKNKKFKKVLIEEIKEEEELLEEKVELSILVLEDKNNDNLPDQFEEFVYEESWSWVILEIVNKDKSLKNYKLFIEKTFKQSIKRTKEWITISWETIPFTQVSFFISWKWNQISTMSDKSWNYIFFFKDFKDRWNYIPKTVLFDKFWNEFILNSKKEIIVDEKYISKLTINKKVKPKKTKKKKTKKKSLNTKIKENLIPKINYIIPKARASNTTKNAPEEINDIYILLFMITTFLFIIIILKRREIL